MSESGAPYGPENLSALLTQFRHREPTYSASSFSLRATFSSSKIIFKGISAEVRWLSVSLGKGGFTMRQTRKAGAVIDITSGTLRLHEPGAQSLSGTQFMTACGEYARVQYAAAGTAAAAVKSAHWH